MRNKDRVKKLGEVWTPPELVSKMLDWLPQDVWSDPTKTVCDPTCGHGNFLVQVVQRKIENGSTPEQALSTTYGVDIMPDNITEAHVRLLNTAKSASGRQPTPEWAHLVVTNVVCHDSLTYDWEFKKKTGPKIEKYVEILLQKCN